MESSNLTAPLLPVPIRDEFKRIEAELAELMPKGADAFERRKRFFFGYLSILVIWYIGQPFADPPVLHYLVQTLGLIMIALATGTLRVLKQVEGCLTTLDDIEARAIRLRGEVGYDHDAGAGNPIEIAKRIGDPKNLAALQNKVAAMSEELKSIKSILRRGSFEAYMEMFAIVGKDPREREKPKTAAEA